MPKRERVRELEAENTKLREGLVLEQEVERLRVQLSGCSAAALGHDKGDLQPDDYGWSAAYGDVAALRKRASELEETLGEARFWANYWLDQSEAARDEWAAMFGKEPMPKKVYEYRDAITLLSRLITRLEAENARLKAVAEAAKQVYLYHSEMRCSTWQNLWVTLAALEEAKENG